MQQEKIKKGRAKEGFLIRIKKNLINVKSKLIEKIEEGVIKSVLRIGQEIVNVYSVYNSGDLNRALEVSNNIDFLEKRKTIIGGGDSI